MHLAFVDDSAQQGKRAEMGKLVALGAVVFPEESLKPFADSFYSILDKFGVPRDVEIKWSTPKDDWFRREDKTAVLTPLRKELIQAAASAKASAIVVIWDKSETEELQGRPAESWVLDFLFERITVKLKKAGSRGVIVIDKPGGDHRDEDRWIGDAKHLTEIGTDYVDSDAIVIPILTAPSHHHTQIQLADLITGSVTAAIAGSSFGLELIPDIKPLMHTNWQGSIGGTGLKLYPDNLNNLHHWVLEEKVFTRGTGGIALPAHQFHRYERDDGLS